MFLMWMVDDGLELQMEFTWQRRTVKAKKTQLLTLLQVETCWKRFLLKKRGTARSLQLVSFWNFNALFQPQQHPTRDSHDTFYMKVPAITKELPEDYVERVKRVHDSGGYGSRGYEYDWNRDEATKNPSANTHNRHFNQDALLAPVCCTV